MILGRFLFYADSNGKIRFYFKPIFFIYMGKLQGHNPLKQSHEPIYFEL